MFSDDVLAGLVAQGCKVECPVCGKRCFSEAYRPFHSSGIGQHIRQCHPELESEVIASSKRMERKKKEKERAEKEEKAARPTRKFVVSGAFLDEVVEELEKLISCMEAYYIQGNGDESAREMIDRIEKMHEKAKARGETP